MSPRAAWQLERLGFTEVYDFVAGKVAWMAAGLPVEGTGPHYFVAGEVVDGDAPTCAPASPVPDALAEMERRDETFCLVTNPEGILLGRIRTQKVGEGEERAVGDVMEPGPATVRPVEPLKPLVERMRRAGVQTIPVTTAGGRLLGVVRRDAAEQALDGTGTLRPVASSPGAS
ncbi:MAG: CBS domain-containing protein [Actinomycetota bacterium]